jgi:redox-sensitive bicupin YhaK (pirin superfamily)
MNTTPLLEIESKVKDLGGFPVQRVLPHIKKRMVGPFIFLDHMGPFEFPVGHNMEVKAHPHIGLSTLTYLFEGRIRHRDSLGSDQIIYPGDVNWMTAGSGVSHSERGVEGDEKSPHALHGLQFWVALPDHLEDMAPQFQNYQKEVIPRLQTDSLNIEIIAGSYEGKNSPVQVFCKTTLLNMKSLKSGSWLWREQGQEICVHVIQGEVQINGKSYGPDHAVIFAENSEIAISYPSDAHFVIIGGEAFPRVKTIFWNFVSSSKEKIEKAKLNWNKGDFPMVPGEKERLISPL